MVAFGRSGLARVIISRTLCIGATVALAFLQGYEAPLAVAQSPATSYIQVPDNPFSAIPSLDGQWIFVSLIGSSQGGISILNQTDGQWSLVRTVPCDAAATGMALTHDGKMLIAAAGDDVDFFDTAKLTSGQQGALLGELSDGKGAQSIYVAVTPDDRFAFVSDEIRDTVTVINLDTVRLQGPSTAAVVGRIPVGLGPVGLAFSPDGRYLYSTSEEAPAGYGWQTMRNTVGAEAGEPTVMEGALMVIDVHKAETDPAHAVVSKAPAGYSPVRVALSPDGNTAYVTARNTDTVNVFDTRKLLTAPLHAKVCSVPVGAAPVGIIVVDGGKRLVVANSNRFADPTQNQTLSVIDATHINAGAQAVLTTIPTGAFPRELNVTPDGRTLLVTNYGSGTVEFVDLTHLP